MSDRYFIYSNVGGALHIFLQNFLSHIFISRVFFVVSVVEPCMFPFSSLIFMRSLLPIMMTPASSQFCFHWIIFPNFSKYPHRQRHFASPRSFVLVHHFDCHHHSCSHHLSSEALSLSCCCYCSTSSVSSSTKRRSLCPDMQRIQ